MADLLSIGVSGLRVSQTALAVTGNNITNTEQVIEIVTQAHIG